MPRLGGNRHFSRTQVEGFGGFTKRPKMGETLGVAKHMLWSTILGGPAMRLGCRFKQR